MENNALPAGRSIAATPFAVLCGLGLVAGYALLGATWLVMKTEGNDCGACPSQGEGVADRHAGVHGDRQPVDADRLRAHRGAMVFAAEILFFSVVRSQPRSSPSWPGARSRAGVTRTPIPRKYRSLLVGYVGLLISDFPYIVPPSLTIWQAAAAPATRMFMLMGTLVLLPPSSSGLHDLRLLDVRRQAARRGGLPLIRSRHDTGTVERYV